MRILHVGVGNLDSGGIATYMRSIVAGQRSRGHEVVLGELWPNPETLPEVEHFLPDLSALRRLQDGIRPSVTHLHSQLPDYSQLRMPAVLTTHEHSSHCPSGGRYLHARRKVCDRAFGILPCLWGHYVDRCGSRRPSSILRRFAVTAGSDRFQGEWIAPSNFSAAWLGRRGLAPEHIHVVGNPKPDLPRVSQNNAPDPIVLFLGRLVANKGCDVLLRALLLLPSSRAWIAGDGPERPKLEALARQLGLGDRATFLGWTAPDQVRELLESSRVLAVPSLWPEPFGLVALEAYESGRPVVASAVGGLADLVVDGITGKLVPPDDPVRLAQSLGFYLDDLPAAIRAGTAGKDFASRNHSLVAHLDSLERVYSIAMEGAH